MSCLKYRKSWTITSHTHTTQLMSCSRFRPPRHRLLTRSSASCATSSFKCTRTTSSPKLNFFLFFSLATIYPPFSGVFDVRASNRVVNRAKTFSAIGFERRQPRRAHQRVLERSRRSFGGMRIARLHKGTKSEEKSTAVNERLFSILVQHSNSTTDQHAARKSTHCE